MKKRLLLLAAVALTAACSGPGPAVTTNHDWSEPADPQGDNLAAWTSVSGTHASVGSIDVRYLRNEPYTGAVAQEASLVGWRGEKLSAQLVVWTADGLDDLRYEVSDLRSEDGTVLKNALRARFVNYLLSDWFIPENPCAPANPVGAPSRLMPDGLDEAPVSVVPAHTTRPVWISVEIPREAKPGEYTASVSLKGKGLSETFTLTLEVIDRTLPEPKEWVYHLDLWQHPSAVARVEGVDMWSDAHFEKMKPIMKMLADAGQKVVTATLNKEPWNNQCYDPYADMIVWTKKADGSWEYDFTVFDRWVQFMFDLGITKMVNCYSMLPWNNMLHYRDGATGEIVDVKADPGTPEFKMMWEPFLPAFVSHLKEKGWLEKTCIAMDERSPEDMAEATSLLSRTVPELGISLADNHNIFKKYPYIKNMCESIFAPIDHADILSRREQGLTTTYYVCCSSEFPNTFTFSDPAEAVYFAWHTAAHDYDGFLRWSYNSWTEDPIRDSRFRTWAAGDTYMVYPEGRSSIRFERLVEGVQDFEKMRILRAEPGKGEIIEALLPPFKAGKRFAEWNTTLNAAKETLNELSRK